MDIIVTVGIILILIAVSSLVIHLINAHHAQDVAEHDYDAFHPGDPRSGEAPAADGAAETAEEARAGTGADQGRAL